jgi:hypothetical protein
MLPLHDLSSQRVAEIGNHAKHVRTAELAPFDDMGGIVIFEAQVRR